MPMQHQRDEGEFGIVVVSTDLNDVDADIIETGVDLLGDECGRDVVDIGHALGVLRGQCRCRGHGVALMCGDDLLVCF